MYFFSIVFSYNLVQVCDEWKCATSLLLHLGSNCIFISIILLSVYIIYFLRVKLDEFQWIYICIDWWMFRKIGLNGVFSFSLLKSHLWASVYHSICMYLTIYFQTHVNACRTSVKIIRLMYRKLTISVKLRGLFIFTREFLCVICVSTAIKFWKPN